MPLIRAGRRGELARWVVIAAMICVPLLLLVLTLLVGRGFAETAALRREVIRSYEARADLQRILSLHQDLETGQRGFLITRDGQFLKPYSDAVAKINPALAALSQHLPRDPRYDAELAELRQLSRAKRAFVDRSIRLARSGDRIGAERLIANGEGKRLMDRLREQIAGIDRSERDSLARVTAVFEHARIRVRNETFALQTVLLLLLAGAGYLVFRSNSARDRARRHSEDLAARQEAIFASAKDGMIVLNRSGSIESLNPAAARMFGYAPKALLRRDIGILFEVAPDRGQIESFLRRLQAKRNGSAGEVQEFVGRRQDASAFPLEVSLSAVPLAEATLFLAVCRDISERREIEQIKGEFVATVSHELRTPLTSIAGSLGLITGGAAGAIPAKALRLIQIAQSNSARLVRLINDILDIEKIEAGRMTFDIKPIALDHLLRRAIRDNAGFAAEYGVQVELGAFSGDSVVLADEDRLIQVITNLLSNAVKFSPPKGIVRVAVTALDRRFRISVSDQGEGIPETFRDRIFGKFAQADNSDSRRLGGTGLGLSIVREIVTRLGGSVGFESEVGHGTTFHVDLPATRIAATHLVPPESIVDRSGFPEILHLDDDPDMLRVISSVFDGHAEIYSTPSVVEARAAIRHKRFDAAILDIGLADGSGLEMVPLLRAQDAAIPIMVFTAQEGDAATLEGVDGVLVKSRASLDTLLDDVMRMIAVRQKGRER